jgi:hypothetical protein
MFFQPIRKLRIVAARKRGLSTAEFNIDCPVGSLPIIRLGSSGQRSLHLV